MNYKDVLSEIKNDSIGSLYLIYGDENYLGEDLVKRIKNHLVSSDFEDLNYAAFEGKDLAVDFLIDACETLPFMAKRKLITINNFEALQGKKNIHSESDEVRLIDYFSKIPKETCLVFYGLSSIDSRKKIVKAFGKYGKLCNTTKLNDKELQTWILKYIKKMGKIIDGPELAIILSHLDYLGKNATQTLMDVENEIEKVISYMGDAEKVEAFHIEEVSINTFQNDIFKLLDAVGNKDVKDAMKRLNHILNEGEAIFRLMTTLSNQVKNILNTKLLMEEGYTSKMIAAKIGIHPFVASKCVTQSKGYSEARLRHLLGQFLEMDYMIKSGRINDRIAMELLIIEMCR
ncbi:DNA polymerase III subunit delta [Alkaliphilus peptidifermentans]|uniref:DNA polymerase III subunit delta n=1 Tax=Alkaliphilus peptidifermentans DSM 18978 TaxID=1120976 RepID=A0A1G5BXZ7_9FIRM|nr:DNA polymerase III subunit delta [Alkaliphilus peptidifermentans]SCX95072.1 DNA polymerase III, delta subunit [Alkaliphilus peptidifermentans DSM 18978]